MATLPAPAPPDRYEALIEAIHARFDGMSRTHQRISVYVTQNPNEVAVRSVNGVAEQCGVHASSLVRFAQSLGFSGFKGMQALFQQRLGTAAPGFEARVRALEDEIDARSDQSDYAFLHDLVVRDVAALGALLDDVRGEDLGRAADILARADTIYLLGQLRSAPVVDFLRYMLTMIGKRTVLLDPSGGLATHMAQTITGADAMVAVSFRFYANEVVTIAEAVSRTEAPIVAISDGTLSPLAKSADVLLCVPEHRHTFSRSIAAPSCIAQALVLATAARTQTGSTRPEIPTVTRSGA